MLPSTIKEIDAKAFFDCSMLKEINIPDGLVKIGENAFNKCYALRAIILPDDCSFAETGALQSFANNCKIISNKQPFKVVNGKLLEYRGTKSEVVVPRGVKQIERTAFDRARELITEIILPKSLTKIDIAVFENCKNLKKVQLPEKLKKIDNAVFRNCLKLETINFPDSLEIVGSNAFAGCENLKIATLPSGCDYKHKSDLNASFPQNCVVVVEQEVVETIKENSQEAKPVVFDIRNGILINYFGKDEVVVVPAGVVQIGSNAFHFAKDFVKEVVVPEGVTEIGFSAFKDVEKLEKVELPVSLKVIGMRAFENCKNLEQINLPESLEKVEESAFDGCLKLNLTDISKFCKYEELDDEMFIISDEEDFD